MTFKDLKEKLNSFTDEDLNQEVYAYDWESELTFTELELKHTKDNLDLKYGIGSRYYLEIKF